MKFEHSFVGATLPIQNHGLGVVAVEDEVGSIITPLKLFSLLTFPVNCIFKFLLVFLVL